MALTLKTTIQFPIFTSPLPPSHHHRPPTVIRFSRWHNPRHDQQQPTQKQTEDQLRFNKRFESANNITSTTNLRPPTTTIPPPYKSTGTPSSPSRPSIPGKKSKYSKPTKNNLHPHQHQHPAFKRIVKIRKIPDEIIQENENDDESSCVKVSETGLTYVIPEAPFEFQYSYTETPKIKPLKLREPAIAPFGPGTMPRPWTGKKPLPPSKKKLDFDSFVLPPPHKKGVKPVQAPGPFLPGSGPKYVKSREELLGEPLSKEEIDALIKGCLKSQRQLNMGRDGLTHNMLDNIHAHWKRRRVCKIKCKGVCTVDMDNVRQQLEEKTGGKIIYSKGGVVYLFRGRNYNYKTRPMFPLMLWKPITPVYPRLIKRVPDGLTLEEATEMRMKGRELIPICKLGKNGVYCELVNNVREAFETYELVRVNCEGMNGSDYRRIGAKLKDLVPCVLVSFELEHILMWRGRDWKSMFADGNGPHETTNPDTDVESVVSSTESSSSSSECLTEDELEENGITLSTPEHIDDNNNATPDDIEDTISENNENRGNQDCLVGVMSLLNQAVQDGIAFVLEDSCVDADMAYAKAVAFAQHAVNGPTFRMNNRPKKVALPATEKQEGEETVVKDAVITSSVRKQGEKRSPRTRKKDFKDNYLDIVPQATLRVDELAKLLG